MISSASMLPMKFHHLLLFTGVTVLCSSGCTERLQGIGGGALTPVKVTVLRDANADAGDGTQTQSAPVETVAGYGTLKGRVTISGALTPRPMLVTVGQAGIADAVCTQNGVPNESVLVSADGGLANVFVYLKKAPNIELPPASTEPVVVDQQGCKFVPHAAIVRVGQTLRMINSDPAAHNVSLPAIGFNQTISKGQEQLFPIKSKSANPVGMTCSFHGWMSGNVLFVDHPWAVVTGPDGSFEIKGVPAGNMEFVVWHEKAGLVERSLKINIPVDGVAEQAIAVDAGKLNK
jgi:plastocyanin